MSKKVNVAFIGAGGIARTHMSYLVKISGVELVAAADVNPEAIEQTTKIYSVGKTFTDWRKMLAMPGIDAVSVCTPNKHHYRPVIAALQAGKHVLVEKPLAMNAREGQKMIQAAQKAKRVLQIGFQHRFRPDVQFIRHQVATGKLGKILYVKCCYVRRRGIPSWGVFGQKELQGGGPMIDLGVHALEMAHYVMGSPKPISVRGACYTCIGNKKPAARSEWGDWDYKTYNVEDLAIGLVTFDDGSTLLVESSFAAHIDSGSHNLQVIGTEGGATLSPLRLSRDENGYMVNIEPAFVGKWDPFEYKMQHFIECVRDGKPCEAPGEDGLTIQKIIDAIYKSSALNKEVAIK
jgi:predicted dehydrogenase